ncbi:ABC transporter permease [Maledivibacter halophilus]|uniref:Peptide/nickel transport system permease protein n=1 Tax=Maledivibacter halophilus TaxID=36842 RepID=A0A1T5LT55_9FIRM|nr:ABC transporter permease [Maledivibacter halophilus]SKC79005.1 peptide/nickel transport system permease protein [Maledivibacter halophilus]
MKSKKNRSQSKQIWMRLKKNKLAIIGLGILIIILLFAIFADFIADYETEVIKQNMKNRLQAPSKENWLGTDSYGRDIFARIVHGSRYSLTIGISTIVISLFVGGFFGSIAGYYGGRIDNIIMRVMDMFLAIPSIILAIAIVASLGTGVRNLIIALSISNVPQFARLIRSSILTVKESEFIEAAHAVGTNTSEIIIKHILPNSIGPIIVQATFGVATSILAAASLSFLGIGIRPPAPEWGAILSEGKEYIRYTPYLVLFPGIAIAITVLSLNLLGDGLRDALDPSLKN